MAHPVPFTPWSNFLATWNWRQGEHVTVIGPTGTGKTTLIRGIMPKRYAAGAAVNVLATKSRDANLDAWAARDRLTIVDRWPPPRPLLPWQVPADVVMSNGVRVPWSFRLMTWPRDDRVPVGLIREHMADVHRLAIQDMYREGNWCIVAEELFELTRMGLGNELEQMWTQGRSAGITVVGATQRPVGIPLHAYNNASHLFMFNDNDERNLQRLQGIGGMNERNLRDYVRGLEGHDVLYVGVRDRTVIRTRVPVKGG